MKEKTVLCGANSYEQKYYLNKEFAALPTTIKEELQVMCVLFTEDVGGILTLNYDEEGTLYFDVVSEERDFSFDEIGSVLKVKDLQRTKAELLESLEVFYKIVVLKEEV